MAGLALAAATAAAPAVAAQHPANPASPVSPVSPASPGGPAASHARAATTGQRTPTRRMNHGPHWVHLAAGGGHTCATRANGTLWCWGNNTAGFLVIGQGAVGKDTNPSRPRQVTTPAPGGWASVSAGQAHTCATRAGGTLWCWGFADYGQLGLTATGSGGDVEVLPRQVTSPAPGGWAGVTTGYDHTCATRTGGALWCWGLNGNGQIGLGFFSEGTDGDSAVFDPHQVTTPAVRGWATVAAGEAHNCATRTGGALWCWGANVAGELGIGNNTDQDLPQHVTCRGPRPAVIPR